MKILGKSQKASDLGPVAQRLPLPQPEKETATSCIQNQSTIYMVAGSKISC